MNRGPDFPNTEGRTRVVIESVRPQIDGGRFPIKRVLGEPVAVEADAFTDGHDVIACALLHRPETAAAWQEIPLEAASNDRWRAEFRPDALGVHRYTVTAWVDAYGTFRRDLEKRVAAGQDVGLDAQVGAALLEASAARAPSAPAGVLRAAAEALRSPTASGAAKLEVTRDAEIARLQRAHAARPFASTFARELTVLVERERARTGAWYEFFPRSCGGPGGAHGRLADAERALDAIAEMGFDVVYLPPVHPIGSRHRKGRDNAPLAAPGEPGSPWAIGARDGGHKAIHPDLGTLTDMDRLIARAHSLGLEIAMDIAFQCSPDHPYVADHPEWFRKRPDGSIQYAENPPKKYQDIFPFDFECEAWRALWEELRSVVLFWAERGVRIFRVDNPHTKPFAFWEWLLAEVRRAYPDAVFLAEAFTRPKVMYRLAKLGFSQSYNYFPWRNSKRELTSYFTELTGTEVREFFRPALWPNTPDILPEFLQLGGRAAFVSRLVLAATLGATYGIYGPAYELGEAEPREAGSEEYRGSEKYEIRSWDTAPAAPFRALIARVNRIRRENPALQIDSTLVFHEIESESLLCFSKRSVDGADAILVVVNLDPHHAHSGWVDLEPGALGLDAAEPYQVHDLLTDARFLWRGGRNFVELNPEVMPAHIFRLRRRIRTERDFEYFL